MQDAQDMEVIQHTQDVQGRQHVQDAQDMQDIQYMQAMQDMIGDTAGASSTLYLIISRSVGAS